ncbi:hypothetical protein ACLOJK_019691 [Asimina triloba]
MAGSVDGRHASGADPKNPSRRATVGERSGRADDDGGWADGDGSQADGTARPDWQRRRVGGRSVGRHGGGWRREADGGQQACIAWEATTTCSSWEDAAAHLRSMAMNS